VAGGRSPSGVSRSPARRFTFRRLVCNEPARLDTSPSHVLVSHSTTVRRAPEQRSSSGVRRTVGGRCIEMTAKAAPGHPVWIPASAGMTDCGRVPDPLAKKKSMTFRSSFPTAQVYAGHPEEATVIPAQAGIHPSASRPAKLFPALATCPPRINYIPQRSTRRTSLTTGVDTAKFSAL